MLAHAIRRVNGTVENKAHLVKTTLITCMAFLLLACGKPEQAASPAPAPAVSIYSVGTENIGDYREFVARTAASKEADIRTRVEGEILAREFKEGTIVKEDQILFKIDPAAYKASVVQAKAELNSRISAAETAARNLKRGNELVAVGYISQSDYDKLTTEASQTAAAVKSAQAALEKAELDLSYTTVKAPFTGRIGKVTYNVGNIVGPTSNALAILTAVDPMYVTFQLEESDYITYLQSSESADRAKRPALDLSLRLPNNSQYSEKGTLDLADTKIEQGMGTVGLRAIFANPNELILPGLFVTLIAESETKKAMVMVPQAAVQENQQGKFVLVIDNENKVLQRHVVLGRRINALWVVESGLEANENVIIEGLQKVKPGISVNPVAKSVDAVSGVISDLEAK